MDIDNVLTLFEQLGFRPNINGDEISFTEIKSNTTVKIREEDCNHYRKFISIDEIRPNNTLPMSGINMDMNITFGGDENSIYVSEIQCEIFDNDNIRMDILFDKADKMVRAAFDYRNIVKENYTAYRIFIKDGYGMYAGYEDIGIYKNYTPDIVDEYAPKMIEVLDSTNLVKTMVTYSGNICPEIAQIVEDVRRKAAIKNKKI